MVHLPEDEREAIATLCERHAVTREVDRTKQVLYAA